MRDLTFYIIYHDRVYAQNTAGFAESELEKYFTWVAVNEKIPKPSVSWIPDSCHLKEWEMMHYSPFYQMLHAYQNSVFFHLYMNQHLLTSKYVGFGQYDMQINSDDFRSVAASLENDHGEKIVGAFLYPFEALYSSPLDKQGWSLVVEYYNVFSGTNHKLDDMMRLPLFLMHTFIMPRWFFLHMMRCVDKILPKILMLLNWETRHLAGTLERVFALCISAGILEGKFKTVMHLKGVSHLDQQRSSDVLRGLTASR